MHRPSSWLHSAPERVLIQYSFLVLIALLAYLVKGLTGFGPAIVFISLGSQIMDPVRVVSVSPLLDIVAGFILLWHDRQHTKPGYWLILSIPLLIGVAIGSFGLKLAANGWYDQILGTAIVLLGTWFVLRPSPSATQNGKPLKTDLPRKPEKTAMIVAVCSGISGGLFGISGPPLIWYFGTRYQRHAFRRAIIPLFLVEVIGRAIIYASLGRIALPELTMTGYLLPSVLIGLFIGNHWFNILPQKKFERIIGGVLLLSGARLVVG